MPIDDRKRISFGEYDAAHLYELSRENFQPKCPTCEVLQKRLERFLGKREVERIEKAIKKNSYK